jgi:nitrous oxidase accessory protein NosD
MARSARLLGISVAAAVVASLVFVGPAFADHARKTPGDTITVHNGGDIQGAVDRAEPGDTVLVEPGTYHGQVFIGTDRIRLIGAGANQTWLEPGSSKDQCGFCVFGSAHHGEITNPVKGVVIKGFHIDGFKDFGIAGFASMSLNVRNVVASNNGEYGITAFTSHGAEFFSNTTWGNGEAGFYIGDSPDSQALLTDNTAYDSRLGYFIRDASYGYVHDNAAWGNCAGFLFLNTGAPGPAKRWVAENNSSHDNNKVCGSGEGPPFSGVGMALLGTSHVKLIHNFVSGNQAPSNQYLGSGILVLSSKSEGGANPIGNDVERNKLHGNAPFDIWYDGTGKNNSFEGNRCSSASPGGLCG